MTRHDDWLAWRRQGIGASEVPAILGISPFASPWSVWADKAGLLPDDTDNDVMEFGRWAELMIGPWFTDRTGLHVAGEQTWCTHPDHPHHRCTVDGFVLEKPENEHFTEAEWRYALDNALGLLEIKTTGPGRRWDDDDIPPHYAAQCQWQMHVTGHDRVWLAVLMGRRLDIHELARDDADIAFMVERVDQFWADHVVTGEPPPTDGHQATLDALAAVYPTHTPGETATVDSHLIAGLEGAKVDKAAAVADEKRYKAALLAQLGTAEIGTVDGTPAITARSQTRTTTCEACGHKSESDPFRVLRPTKQKEPSA